MNYKRKKSRKQVRCTMCTPVRWLGNTKERRPHRDRKAELTGMEFVEDALSRHVLEK